ncbi:MAG: hypothetical protein JW727_04565 [Candidatus Aenigmarchaeota archaeon]|nr:hypothetical protein [Candidatus Aenigmarchaeota archaeon]
MAKAVTREDVLDRVALFGFPRVSGFREPFPVREGLGFVLPRYVEYAPRYVAAGDDVLQTPGCALELYPDLSGTRPEWYPYGFDFAGLKEDKFPKGSDFDYDVIGVGVIGGLIGPARTAFKFPGEVVRGVAQLEGLDSSGTTLYKVLNFGKGKTLGDILPTVEKVLGAGEELERIAKRRIDEQMRAEVRSVVEEFQDLK